MRTNGFIGERHCSSTVVRPLVILVAMAMVGPTVSSLLA
jgi:hypothetical protein